MICTLYCMRLLVQSNMEQGQVYMRITCGFLAVQRYVWLIVLILLGLMILIIIYMSLRVFILRPMLVVFLVLVAT